ncbi:MAG: hypothetical protein VXZ82_11005 [Planctomycetota bacterium]|nr:hypothetical protein [Planctomycetota bacterium]
MGTACVAQADSQPQEGVVSQPQLGISLHPHALEPCSLLINRFSNPPEFELHAVSQPDSQPQDGTVSQPHSGSDVQPKAGAGILHPVSHVRQEDFSNSLLSSPPLERPESQPSSQDAGASQSHTAKDSQLFFSKSLPSKPPLKIPPPQDAPSQESVSQPQLGGTSSHPHSGATSQLAYFFLNSRSSNPPEVPESQD